MFHPKIALLALALLPASLARAQFGPVMGNAARPARPVGAAAPGSGLLTIVDKDGKEAGVCPLQHTDVQADIAGYVARVVVQQKFRNTSKTPIEAIYTFPLPGDAAVDGMSMKIGARLVSGQIKKREEARQVYEAARNNGQAAALLDQERPNIFTQAVANILPGQDVTIEISYTNLLRYDAGRYEFSFPTVVGPRYTGPSSTSASTSASTSTPDADKISPPITPEGTRAGHDISLSIRLEAGVPLGEVTSPLHPIEVQKLSASRALVKLKDQASLPNKDFILRFKVAGDTMQSGAIAYAPSGGDGYFSLVLQPPAAPPASQIAPKEMVFVIDQTGSQMGWPIEKAKETMKLCIQSLNPGDTFQLIGFNTEVFPCFPAPVPATPANIQAALKYLEPLVGGGGTDILKSVDYALKLPSDAARPRIICYMTDGYVGNEAAILEVVANNRSKARMFPFGVGNSVNRFLIDGMAREGRGVPEYVTLAEAGEGAAKKFTERTANPLLLDVEVDWNGLPVADVYPKHIPDVFTSGPIILKGRYTRGAEGDIILRGLLAGKPWSQKVHVVLPEVQGSGGEAVRTVWAREKLSDLESQSYGAAAKPDVAEQMTAVALEYRLMSAFTSFVAVEEQVVNVGGKQMTLDVPVEMPEGVSYEGIFGAERGGRGRALLGIAALGSLSATTQAGIGGNIAQGGFGAQNGYFVQGGFGGGYGGGGLAGPAGPAGAAGPAGGGVRVDALENRVTALPRTTIAPSVLHRSAGSFRLYDGAADAVADPNRDIIEGTEAGRARLAAMKPEERLALLRSLKLDKALQDLPATLAKEGRDGTLSKPGLPSVEKGRVTVQVWLSSLPEGGLDELKQLGFELAATLRPGQLLLGTLPVEKLDELIALAWVRGAELPRFKSKEDK